MEWMETGGRLGIRWNMRWQRQMTNGRWRMDEWTNGKCVQRRGRGERKPGWWCWWWSRAKRVQAVADDARHGHSPGLSPGLSQCILLPRVPRVPRVIPRVPEVMQRGWISYDSEAILAALVPTETSPQSEGLPTEANGYLLPFCRLLPALASIR